MYDSTQVNQLQRSLGVTTPHFKYAHTHMHHAPQIMTTHNTHIHACNHKTHQHVQSHIQLYNPPRGVMWCVCGGPFGCPSEKVT